MTTYEQTIDLGSTGGITVGEMPTSARPFSLNLLAADQLVGTYYATPLNIDYSPGALAGILGKNQVAPTITNVSPGAGTITRTTSVALRVTDDENEIQRVVVTADYSSGETEVIYDGTNFQPGYTAGSSRTPVTNGYDFVFAADLGWWNSLTLGTLAVDNDGNLATTSSSLAYTVSNPGSAVAPVLSNVSPANASTVLRTDALAFDVTHALGHLGLVVVWATHADGRKELVHDGSAFASAYSGSTRSAVSNGYHFSLVRGATWPTASLALSIAADDTAQSVTALALAYTVSNPGDAVLPIVDAFLVGGDIAIGTAVTFQTTKALGALASQFVLAEHGSGVSEAVWDGSAFTSLYAASSTRTPISGGYAWSIVRTGGWPSSALEVVGVAVDTLGVSASGSESYTVTDAPPPPDVATPTISNMAPAPGNEISRTQLVTLDVTDDQTLRRVLLAVKFPASGEYEVVHDGDVFADRYITLSTRVAVSGGWRYRLRRGAGWPSAPTLRVFAVDTSGNEA